MSAFHSPADLAPVIFSAGVVFEDRLRDIRNGLELGKPSGTLGPMVAVPPSEFRRELNVHLALVQEKPVEIVSRGGVRRAVLVSPEFFDRAIEALEDQADIRALDEARREPSVSFEDLRDELGLD